MAAAENDFLLVAAIDFGTTFSGYAFSFKSNEDQIRTNKSWGASLGFQSYKAPTSVLTTRTGKFLDFGFEAERKYGEALEEDEDEEPDMLLFRHFKMILHNVKNVKSTAVISSVDGTIKPAMDIFAHAIRYLKEHLLKAIALEAGRKPDMTMIRWVITVPAIWSEESKQFMREAAHKAGCIDRRDSDRLVIALEPEAASLCCRRLNIAQYADPKGINFPFGTKYLVLDCGGGTIDVTAHQVELDQCIKELHRASGGAWGGTKVDNNFMELLESILGKHFVNTFRQKHPHEWLQFLTNFERTKKSFKPDGEAKINLSLQYSMVTLYAEMNNGQKIDKVLKASSDKGVTFGNGMLVIKHDAAKRLFAPVVDSIVGHTQSLVKDEKLAGLKYILMVGGFSECEALQEAIKERFERNGCKVLIPSEAQLAIIKGAVMFGHKPSEIGTRISRYTFGCDYTPVFDQNVHDIKHKKTIEGQELCYDVFCVILEQNEEISIGSQKTKTFSTDSPSQKAMLFRLFSIDGVPRCPVQYVDDDNVREVGKVRIQMSGSGTNREVKLILTFGGTEIKVDAVDTTSGATAATAIDFLSH